MEIWRYEQYCFHCRKVQIALALRDLGMPIEYLYFNSFEPTGNVAHHLFVENQNRWSFESDCLDKARLIEKGIGVHQVGVESFEKLCTTVRQLTDDGYLVYLWACNDVLPYKKLHVDYHETELVHSIIVTNVAEDASGLRFEIRDSTPMHRGFLSQDELERVYRHTPHWTGQIEFLTLRNAERLTKDKALRDFTAWLREFRDEGAFYDEIPMRIGDAGLDRDERLALYETYHQAFSILTGSRYLFLAFLRNVGLADAVADELQAAVEICEYVKMMFLRGKVSGKLNPDVIVMKCQALKEHEHNVIVRLKKATGDVTHAGENYRHS